MHMIPTPTLATADAFYTAFIQADLIGKLIFLSLITLSIVSWVVLLYQIFVVKTLMILSQKYTQTFQSAGHQILGFTPDTLPKLKAQNIINPFSHIFLSLKKKTLEILDKNLYFSRQKNPDAQNAYLYEKDIDLLESHVMTTVSSQVKQLEKNLFILTTVVTLAPFLGLLGTVWGILQTFSGLQSGASLVSNTAVLAGLATALTTTVLGLVIAIPALVAYNYLKSRTRGISSDAENFLYTLLSTLEIQYRPAPQSP